MIDEKDIWFEINCRESLSRSQADGNYFDICIITKGEETDGITNLVFEKSKLSKSNRYFQVDFDEKKFVSAYCDNECPTSISFDDFTNKLSSLLKPSKQLILENTYMYKIKIDLQDEE